MAPGVAPVIPESKFSWGGIHKSRSYLVHANRHKVSS